MCSLNPSKATDDNSAVLYLKKYLRMHGRSHVNTNIRNIIIWKIKLIYAALIHCKFMCSSQHFTIYLLSLQNILFFDPCRTSYVILLIYMLDWNWLAYVSPLSDTSRFSFWKTERLPRTHIPIDFINENAIFLRIYVIVTL